MDDGGTKNDETVQRPAGREGRIIIFVNPHSGQGKSTLIYQRHLLPLIEAKNIEYQLVVSDQQGSITKFIQSLTASEINQLRSMIVVSGDGAVHEVINAVMHHEHWQAAIKVPVGIIPSGSGNGLAYTLIRLKYPDSISKSDAIRVCCDAALQSNSCKTDLVKLSFGENSTIWSFLSIGWGLLADLDIDSEWLRRMGELRFTIYGLIRSFTSREYACRLSYKVSKDYSNLKQLSDESNSTSDMYKHPIGQSESSTKDKKQDDWFHIEDKFSCLYAVYQSHISSVTNFSPKSTLTDRIIYLTYIRGNLSPCMAVKFLLSIKDGSHETLPFVRVVPVTTFKFQPLEKSKVVVDGELISWELNQGPLTAEVAPDSMKLLWN